jgi:hypothetical protein
VTMISGLPRYRASPRKYTEELLSFYLTPFLFSQVNSSAAEVLTLRPAENCCLLARLLRQVLAALGLIESRQRCPKLGI